MTSNDDPFQPVTVEVTCEVIDEVTEVTDSDDSDPVCLSVEEETRIIYADGEEGPASLESTQKEMEAEGE